MANKKNKGSRSAATEAVRSAVDQAFTAGQVPFSRERAFELVDDLSQVAGRLREALDDLRPNPIEELRALLRRLDALESRVASLEAAAAKPVAPARAAAKKPVARAAAKKPAARKPAATSSAAKKPAATKPAARPAARRTAGTSSTSAS